MKLNNIAFLLRNITQKETMTVAQLEQHVIAIDKRITSERDKNMQLSPLAELINKRARKRVVK